MRTARPPRKGTRRVRADVDPRRINGAISRLRPASRKLRRPPCGPRPHDRRRARTNPRPWPPRRSPPVRRSPSPSTPLGRGGKDVGFAVGIVLILCLFFLPVPAFMIDFGLALSIALVGPDPDGGLWIQKPLEFSAFPTVLLVATILRLALNISTTRLILSPAEGRPRPATSSAASPARDGRRLRHRHYRVPILMTINFLVITKGATRIAEVGARFTLDAIPGKQMAIDADLSAGLSTRRSRRRAGASSRRRAPSSARWTAPRNSCAATRSRPHHPRGQHLWRHRHRRHAPRPAARLRRRRVHKALGRRRPRHPENYPSVSTRLGDTP